MALAAKPLSYSKGVARAAMEPEKKPAALATPLCALCVLCAKPLPLFFSAPPRLRVNQKLQSRAAIAKARRS